MADDYYRQCLDMLKVFYETPTATELQRKEADQFLQVFTLNPISWDISDRLLHERNLPSTFYFFAANTLAIRLRSSFTDLPNEIHRIKFKDSLITILSEFFFKSSQISPCFTPGSTLHLTVVERLSTALSIFILHMISINEWNNAIEDIAQLLLPTDILSNTSNIITHLYNPQILAQVHIFLKIIGAIPDTLDDTRFIFLPNANEELVLQSLQRFKPFLLQLISTILFTSKPIMWNTKFELLVQSNATKFNITPSQYQTFATTYQTTLLTIPSNQRSIYLTLAEQSLYILRTWSLRHQISFKDVVSFTITPSNDINHTYPQQIQSPLPIHDTTLTLFTQTVPQLTATTISYSLYNIILQLLTYPQLTQSTTTLLSILYTLQPQITSRNNQLTSHPSQEQQQQQSRQSHATFITEYANTPNTHKPDWLLPLISTTIQSLCTVYQRTYNDSDLDQVSSGLMTALCDFMTIFIDFLPDDPNLDLSQDVFNIILTQFLQILDLTLQPATQNQLAIIVQQLLSTITASPNSSLQHIPPPQLTLLQQCGNLFTPLFLFENLSNNFDLVDEELLFSMQIITARKTMIVTTFEFLSSLTQRLSQTRDHLYYVHDNHNNAIEQIMQIRTKNNSNVAHQNLLDQHQTDLNIIRQQIEHINARVDLFLQHFLHLIKIIVSAAQYKCRDLLPTDSQNFFQNEDRDFRQYASKIIMDLIDLIGNQKVFSVWFSFFKSFEEAYQRYIEIYPPQHPQHPNNNIQHSIPQLCTLTQQALPFFQQYVDTSISTLATNSTLTSQPQHDLANFAPKVQLWNPLTAPDGWQPLEQYMWAFSVIAKKLSKVTTSNLLIHDGSEATNSIVEQHHGCLFSRAQFHVLSYGTQFHPDGPYQDTFQDSFIQDEIEILTFLEQLGSIFSLFINQLHRNINTVTFDTMCSFIKAYCPFLTVPVCLDLASGYIVDSHTKTILMTKTPLYKNNAEISRHLIQMLVSFAMHPGSLVTAVPTGCNISHLDNRVSHSILTLTPPSSALVKASARLSTGLFISQTACSTLLQLIINNAYAICQSYGEEIFRFFLFLIKRVLYNSSVVQPNYFFSQHTNQVALTHDTARCTETFSMWIAVTMSQDLCILLSVLPQQQVYHSTLTWYAQTLFSFIRDTYQQYTTWITSGIEKLNQLFITAKTNPQTLQQYQFYLQLFLSVTWLQESVLVNILQSTRSLFLYSGRPNHLTEQLPERNDAWNNNDTLRHQLIATAIRDSMPFFQDMVKNFSIQPYTLPTAEPQSTVVLREHVIVDKVSSLWATALCQATVHMLPILPSICQTACEFFQCTQHSSFLYLADCAIRVTGSIERAYLAANKPLDGFSAKTVAEQFANYFIPTVFLLADATITRNHPQHIQFSFQTQSFLQNPNIFMMDACTQQKPRLEQILQTFPSFFPTNHKSQQPPDPHGQIQSTPHLFPISVSPFELSTNAHLQQVQIVSQLFMEHYPEVVEDFVGLLTSLRHTQPQIFFTSPYLPQIMSFLTSALYSPNSQVYDLVLQLTLSIFNEFIYRSNVRDNYPSATCNTIDQAQQLINQYQQNPPQPPFPPQKRADIIYSGHIRYLNLLDTYKLNYRHQPLYLFLSLYTPTFFIHLIHSLFVYNRPAHITIGFLEPIIKLFTSLAQFMYESLESMTVDSYPITQLSSSIIHYLNSFFSEYNATIIHSSSNSSIDQTWSQRPPISIHQFSPQLQQQFQSLHSQDVPFLISLFIDAFSIFLTPHFTQFPLLQSKLFQLQTTQPNSLNSTNFPQPEAYSSQIDPMLLLGIIKSFLTICTAPTPRALHCLNRDLTTLILFVKGDSNQNNTNNND